MTLSEGYAAPAAGRGSPRRGVAQHAHWLQGKKAKKHVLLGLKRGGLWAPGVQQHAGMRGFFVKSNRTNNSPLP